MYTWGEDNKFECDLCAHRVTTIRIMNGGKAKSIQLCVDCHSKIRTHYSEISLTYKGDDYSCTL